MTPPTNPNPGTDPVARRARLRGVTGLLFATTGMLVSHAGNLWLGLAFTMVALPLLLHYLRWRFPNQFRLNPSGPSVVAAPLPAAYSIRRHDDGTFTVTVEGDCYTVRQLSTGHGWTVTSGPYLRLLARTRHGFQVPYPTLDAAVMALRAIYRTGTEG